jgi:hypothetical protein
MSKAHETMTKRRVTLADGRYLIYYTFAPETSEPLPPNAAEDVPAMAVPAEEN